MAKITPTTGKEKDKKQQEVLLAFPLALYLVMPTAHVWLRLGNVKLKQVLFASALTCTNFRLRRKLGCGSGMSN